MQGIGEGSRVSARRMLVVCVFFGYQSESPRDARSRSGFGALLQNSHFGGELVESWWIVACQKRLSITGRRINPRGPFWRPLAVFALFFFNHLC
jgi:hypothetical protein